MANVVHGICRVSLGDRPGEAEVEAAADELLRLGRTNDALESLYNLAFALGEESPSEGIKRMDASVELAGRLGADSAVWISRAARLHYLVVLGRFDEVTLEAEAILAHTSGSSDLLAKTFTLLNLAQVELHRGGSSQDLAELEELVRGTIPMSLWIVAAAAHARGDEASAQALLVEAADVAQGSIPPIASACLDSGLADLAEELLVRETRDTASDRAERAIAEAVLARRRGDLTSSTERFSEAARAFEGLEMIVGKARALQGLGECLLQMDQTDEGLSSLRLAESLWRDLGATVRIGELEELLATTS
jgi:tetratricopeptide (TPR) repeat protein